MSYTNQQRLYGCYLIADTFELINQLEPIKGLYDVGLEEAGCGKKITESVHKQQQLVINTAVTTALVNTACFVRKHTLCIPGLTVSWKQVTVVEDKTRLSWFITSKYLSWEGGK